MKSPSQSAIAKQAGVARTTVSLVLRGGEGLAQKTIDKVMQAADELGYRPNLLVQGIRTGKSKTVGVMIPPQDSYWSAIIYGIHDELTANDYAPVFMWSGHRNDNYDEVGELDRVHSLIDSRVDGVILWPYYANMYAGHLAEFSSRDLPVVSIDYQIQNSDLVTDSVCADDRLGGRLITEHLLESEARYFVHFCGPQNEAWSRDRRLGCEEVLKQRGVGGAIIREVPLDAPREGVIREVLSGLEGSVAVFAATDHVAREVYGVAQELALKIPSDLRVAGFSDLDFAAYMNPPLSTIAVDPYVMGRKAAESILARINGAQNESQMISFPVKLLVRGSSSL